MDHEEEDIAYISFTKTHATGKTEEKQGSSMKGPNEKAVRMPSKPKKEGILPSYSDGQKPTRSPKPKSLTPLKGKR